MCGAMVVWWDKVCSMKRERDKMGGRKENRGKERERGAPMGRMGWKKTMKELSEIIFSHSSLHITINHTPSLSLFTPLHDTTILLHSITLRQTVFIASFYLSLSPSTKPSFHPSIYPSHFSELYSPWITIIPAVFRHRSFTLFYL